MNKILNGCVQLGLNTNTGISPFIPLKDLEGVINIKLTGNGSKLRRDVKPFSFFKLVIVKNKATVIGYQFNGYQDVQGEISKLQDQTKTTQLRVIREAAKTKKRLVTLQNLLLRQGNNPLFSSADL